MIRYLTILMAQFLTVMVAATGADNMRAFPTADEGMTRHVVHLPKLDDESLVRVQLIAGKNVEVDSENRYFFGGSIETEIIKGWGFPCYRVAKLGPLAGTRMAINPNASKARRFIAIGGEPFLIRYNSRLPIVVYAPDGLEIRYRLWQASPETKVMDKG